MNKIPLKYLRILILRGGVAVTLRNSTSILGPIGTFTPFKILNNIMKKVWEKKEKSLAEIISSRGTYRFSEQLFNDIPDVKSRLGKGSGNMIVSNSFDKLPDILTKERKSKDDYKILGRYKGKREYRYIQRKYVLDNDFINFYNIFVPKANGSGVLGEILSTPLIGNPLEGSTDTFISIGSFTTNEEVKAAIKYIKSKFARVMLGILKITQDNPKSVWAKIPLQDFTSNSDIDWTKSIHEIDEQLYRKYNLSEEEIEFIETKVKEMN